MELTKEQRLKIYKNIINTLFENKELLETCDTIQIWEINESLSPYVCDNLLIQGLLISELKPELEDNEILKYFPEFKLFNPLNGHLGWWEDYDINSRISALLLCIEMLKD